MQLVELVVLLLLLPVICKDYQEPLGLLAPMEILELTGPREPADHRVSPEHQEQAGLLDYLELLDLVDPPDLVELQDPVEPRDLVELPDPLEFLAPGLLFPPLPDLLELMQVIST